MQRKKYQLCCRGKHKRNIFLKGALNKRIGIDFSVLLTWQEVMEVLIENGADVNKNLGANFNRITPLIMVAQEGDLNLVRFFIDHRAKIEKPGKRNACLLLFVFPSIMCKH